MALAVADPAPPRARLAFASRSAFLRLGATFLIIPTETILIIHTTLYTYNRYSVQQYRRTLEISKGRFWGAFGSWSTFDEFQILPSVVDLVVNEARSLEI